MANRTLAAIRAAFNWAIDDGWPTDKTAIKTNPCWGIEATEEEPCERHLSNGELKKLFKNLPKTGMAQIEQDALVLALLTGCRIGEVCGMSWREIEGDEWRIPGSRTKNGKMHLVFLSDEAQVILGRHEGDGFVFASETTASGHIRVDAVEKALRLSMDALKLEAFTPHDLRRTLGTWLGGIAKANEQEHDRMLNHFKKSMRGVYDRSKHNDEVRQYWKDWGTHISSLQAPNVAQLKREA